MAREKVVDILHVSVPGVIKGLVIRGLGGVRVMQYWLISLCMHHCVFLVAPEVLNFEPATSGSDMW